jgi:hypothetical protein
VRRKAVAIESAISTFELQTIWWRIVWVNTGKRRDSVAVEQKKYSTELFV